MSEIFSWLKRSELKRQDHVSDFMAKSANSQLLHSHGKPGQPDPPHAVPIPAPEIEEAKSAGSFDFERADPRIRAGTDPFSLTGEQFRLLRAKLLLMQRQRGTKTVLVTSSIPDEGKTFTACCLAVVLAQEPGKRTLLVEADLRRPKASRNLGLLNPERFGGLSGILRGDTRLEDTLLSSLNGALFLLPAGSVPPNPSELLSNQRLEGSIKRLTELFDWLVIDSPPALSIADPTLIVPHCDATLLVVRANRTPSKLITESIDRVGREKICGVVMNRVSRIMSSRYYYRYYHKSGKPPKK